MAEFFFNRHVDSDKVEPFSNYKYSKQDGYYNFNPGLSCDDTGNQNDALTTAEGSYHPQSSRCGVDIYPTTSLPSSDNGYTNEQNTKRNIINNCLCKYKKNVNAYLVKKPTNDTTNGITNDNSEKYSEMMLKNINLGIGLGLMMIYIYTTNY